MIKTDVPVVLIWYHGGSKTQLPLFSNKMYFTSHYEWWNMIKIPVSQPQCLWKCVCLLLFCCSCTSGGLPKMNHYSFSYFKKSIHNFACFQKTRRKYVTTSRRTMTIEVTVWGSEDFVAKRSPQSNPPNGDELRESVPKSPELPFTSASEFDRLVEKGICSKKA